MTQNRSEASRKRESNFGLNLNLIDPLELVLDRILGGHNLGIFRLDLGQCAIKRGRLA